MEFYQLLYFETLAKVGNISHAAERLNLSQSALSRSIQNLEKEVGAPLFIRESRGVTLNTYGEVFLEHATNAINEIQTAEHKIQDLIHPTHGTIRLAFTQPLGSDYIPMLISAFTEKYPNIQFKLSQDTTRKILKQLNRDEIDIGFCSPFSANTTIEKYTILEEELIMLVPKNHPLSKQKEVHLVEFALEKFIVFKEDTSVREVTDYICHEAGFEPTIVFEGIAEKSIIDLVSKNFGVAIVPIGIPLFDFPVVPLKILNQPVHHRTQLTWAKDRYISPAVRNFIQFTKKLVDEQSNL